MAATFGWKGVVDTDLDFSEFYGADHTIVLWFALQYPNAYAGPMLSVNGVGNYLVGQGDRNTQAGPHLISRIEGAVGVHLPAALHAGRWYHLAVIREGSDVRVLLDGQILGSPLSLTGTDIPIGTLRLGRPSPGMGVDGQEAQFYGMLDRLAVYSRALTGAEIEAQSLNVNHLTENEPGLLAGWFISEAHVSLPPFGQNRPPTLLPPPNKVRHALLSGQSTRVSNMTGTDADMRAIPLPENPAMELPFRAGEAWGVTQGVAAEFSHRGYAAFCWDFQKADAGAGWSDVYPNGSFKAPIYAAGVGVVTLVSQGSPPVDPADPESENMVWVRDAGGFIQTYLHLLKGSVLASVGQALSTGQLVAQICTEWRSPSRPVPHLHFAVEPDPNDEIGKVTVPVAFGNYQVRQADGSWLSVTRGIPQQSQIVRRIPSFSVWTRWSSWWSAWFKRWWPW